MPYLLELNYKISKDGTIKVIFDQNGTILNDDII